MNELNENILLVALKEAADWNNGINIVVNGDDQDDFDDWWHNGSAQDVITLKDLGDFITVEHNTGLNTGSTDKYEAGATVWDNWIIIEQNGRFFKLDGSDDSWDGKGWEQIVYEVEPTSKTIYIWGRKLDY
jgi:hypothetical protein